jgi:aspartyl-tRNA(Asn)/glutamyl-tRNA(Gln) amidotransferase subunit B
MGEVLRLVHEGGKTLDQIAVPASHLAGLVRAIAEGKVAHAAAKKVFARMAATGEAPLPALAALGLEQVKDASTIEPVVREVVQKNPAIVADIRAGKTKALDALKGQVMRATKGKADPTLVHELLTRLIGS